MQSVKKCKACKSVRQILDFIRNDIEFVGCNICAAKRKIAQVKYYEKTKEYKHEYYLKNKDHISEQRKTDKWKKENTVRRKKHRNENIDIYMLWNAKDRAKKRSLPFNLTLDDIKIPEFCPALGIKISIGDGETTPNSPTLDRIIPELGYIVGNVCVISHRANRIKNDSSLKDLENIVEY